MKTDKQLKAELKVKASQDPDSYYATSILKQEGFQRSSCTKCNLNFWAQDKTRTICGDSSCIGVFSVANNKLCKQQLSYLDVWNTFQTHFQKRN